MEWVGRSTTLVFRTSTLGSCTPHDHANVSYICMYFTRRRFYFVLLCACWNPSRSPRRPGCCRSGRPWAPAGFLSAQGRPVHRAHHRGPNREHPVPASAPVEVPEHRRRNQHGPPVVVGRGRQQSAAEEELLAGARQQRQPHVVVRLQRRQHLRRGRVDRMLAASVEGETTDSTSVGRSVVIKRTWSLLRRVARAKSWFTDRSATLPRVTMAVHPSASAPVFSPSPSGSDTSDSGAPCAVAKLLSHPAINTKSTLVPTQAVKTCPLDTSGSSSPCTRSSSFRSLSSSIDAATSRDKAWAFRAASCVFSSGRNAFSP